MTGRLLELTVTDLAVIERVRLALEDGFNVITGETGAGKSLLIDALGLAIGARADTSLVRHGAESARVEALFDRLPEPLIAAREVAAGGRSTARLDDETVTAARLADEVGPLVEIHGQHDQQHLLDERWQRDLLDGFGGHGELRGAVEAAVAAWRANRTALDELVVDPRELARRLEVLEYEASEIAAARIRPGESDEIKARLAAAQHGEAIARGAAAVHEALTADGGAREAVAGAVREARTIARLDGRFDGLAERLAGLEAELEDAAAESRTLAEAVDHDPASLAAMEERLGVIYSLERRYGDDEAAVVAHGERSAAEVERLRGVDGERARREADDERLLAAAGLRRSGALERPCRGRGPAGSGRRRGPRRPRLPGGRLRGRGRPAHRRRGRGGAGARRRRGRLRRRRGRPGRLPPRPERRGAVPPARPDRLGRRAVAGGPRDQAGPRRGRRHARPSCSTRWTPGSGAGAPTRSGAASGRWPDGTRCCA